MSQRRPGGIPRPTPSSNIQPQSRLRPPTQFRSSSVPPVPSSTSSRPNITTASRSGGQIPRMRTNIPPPAASSTMRSDYNQSFAPKITSSKTRPPGMRTSKDMSRIETKPTGKPPPSRIEQQVRSSLLNQSRLKPGEKVRAKSKIIYQKPPQTLDTPAGREPILQQSVLEKRVQRSQEGEIITKNVALSTLNEDTGYMESVEMGIKELDPKYATTDQIELIGVTSALSVTPEYTTLTKDYIRSTTQEDLNINPQEVAKLIEEEVEDVNNTLRMIPPDFILQPGKYGMKQRLQKMRINTESVALLEQSIIRPEVTADEAQEDLSPESLSTVMYTIESGIKPESSPDQVFNSLFKEPPNEHFINLTSITPGPLQDVVVPTEVPKDIHQEVIGSEMTNLTDRLINMNPEDIPCNDLFSRVMDDAVKNPEKGKNNPMSFPMIQNEKSLWVNADLEPLVNIVGAEPVDVLDPFNLEKLEESGNLENEMRNGVEYFLESNPVQYMNRVQLRGTQLPSYFPGYIMAVPDLPDVVKIAQNPDEVFAIAWKSVQPKYFEDDSMMSVLG